MRLSCRPHERPPRIRSSPFYPRDPKPSGLPQPSAPTACCAAGLPPASRRRDRFLLSLPVFSVRGRWQGTYPPRPLGWTRYWSSRPPGLVQAGGPASGSREPRPAVSGRPPQARRDVHGRDPLRSEPGGLGGPSAAGVAPGGMTGVVGPPRPNARAAPSSRVSARSTSGPPRHRPRCRWGSGIPATPADRYDERVLRGSRRGNGGGVGPSPFQPSGMGM
jgi:hypothetical protein